MVTSTIMEEQHHVVHHEDPRLHERHHCEVTSTNRYHSDVTSSDRFHSNVASTECFHNDVTSSERFRSDITQTNVANGSVSSACLTALSYCHDYGIGKYLSVSMVTC